MGANYINLEFKSEEILKQDSRGLEKLPSKIGYLCVLKLRLPGEGVSC